MKQMKIVILKCEPSKIFQKKLKKSFYMPYDNIEDIWKNLLIKADISLVSDFLFEASPPKCL